MTARSAIARIEVTLKDVEPPVMRRLDVPLKIRLDRLHLVLQAAMGWTDSHLYEFMAGGSGWGVPSDEWPDGPLPAEKTTLFAVLEDCGTRTIHYVYDLGDTWDHVVRVERVGDADPAILYPRLITATGRCPPEDVGGVTGYADFLAALRDPVHEDHERMITWAGGPFDPDDPNLDRILDDLDRLARKWAPRSRKPKAPPR